jgi:pyrimidine-nucleoside phosphorylase
MSSDIQPIKELLRRKRDGGVWSDAEVARFVQGVTTKEVTDAQSAAFLMAACIHGLTVEETASLTTHMANSGARLQRGLTSRPAIDKHSTGGVGDKVSLLLSPLAISCGLAVPMISGRGLGHTGGTVDKLESIFGMNMELPMHRCSELLRKNFGFMSAATEEIAPADRRLYALRDATGTVENVGLITASILSKKLAEGLDGLVMDVKVGRGAFMKTFDDARKLGTSIASVAAAAGLPCTIVYTDMNAPLGRSIGNWNEVVEAEQALASYDEADARLRSITEQLVAEMLLLAKVTSTDEEALHAVRAAWRSGIAHETFHRMLREQGGNWRESVRRAQHHCISHPVSSVETGRLDVDAMNLAMAVLMEGGGRLRNGDRIDPYVGIDLLRQPGDDVTAGDVVCIVHAQDHDVAKRIAARILPGFTARYNKALPPTVIDVIRPLETDV